MDERLRFVARLLEGEPMSEVCRAFGISRKTGYKIFNRYKDHGLEALTDRSRRPVRYANQLPPQIESSDRQPQAREAALGRAQDPRAPGAPPGRRCARAGQEHHPCRACTAMGWSRRIGRPAPSAPAARPCRRGRPPTTLWCADFKGEFKLGNGQYCYPLTVTDHASRYPAAVRGPRVHPRGAGDHRLRAAVPRARPAPGHPLRQRRALCQPQRLFNLSKLSVWWLRLGIAIERIKPGHPQQNGRHERMHLTLKKEATRPPGQNSLQQQARFDAFRARVQCRAPARGARHEVPGRGLLRLTQALCRLA